MGFEYAKVNNLSNIHQMIKDNSTLLPIFEANILTDQLIRTYLWLHLLTDLLIP